MATEGNQRQGGIVVVGGHAETGHLSPARHGAFEHLRMDHRLLQPAEGGRVPGDLRTGMRGGQGAGQLPHPGGLVPLLGQCVLRHPLRTGRRRAVLRCHGQQPGGGVPEGSAGLLPHHLALLEQPVPPGTAPLPCPPRGGLCGSHGDSGVCHR